MQETEQEFLKKLIDDHWEYLRGVLQFGGSDIEEIEYHYKTAMEHGWKHHKEYVDGKK